MQSIIVRWNRWSTLAGLAFLALSLVGGRFTWILMEEHWTKRPLFPDYTAWTTGMLPHTMYDEGERRPLLPQASLESFASLMAELRAATNASVPDHSPASSIITPEAFVNESETHQEGKRPAQGSELGVNVELATFASTRHNVDSARPWFQTVSDGTRRRFIAFAAMLRSRYKDNDEVKTESHEITLAKAFGFDRDRFPDLRVPSVYLAESSGARVSFPARSFSLAPSYNHVDRPWWTYTEFPEEARKDSRVTAGNFDCGITGPYVDARSPFRLVRTIVCWDIDRRAGDTDRRAPSPRTRGDHSTSPYRYVLGVDLAWNAPKLAPADLELVRRAATVWDRRWLSLSILAIVFGLSVALGRGPERADGFALRRTLEVTAAKSDDAEVARSQVVQDTHEYRTGLLVPPRWLSWSRQTAASTERSIVATQRERLKIDIGSDPNVRGRELWQLFAVGTREWTVLGVRIIVHQGLNRPFRLVALEHTGRSVPTLAFLHPDTGEPIDVDIEQERFRGHVLRFILMRQQSEVRYLSDPLPQRVPESLRVVALRAPEAVRHFQQIERLHAGRFRFQDGVGMAGALYPGGEVRAVIRLPFLLSLLGDDRLPALISGNSVERIVLCCDESEWQDAVSKYAKQLDRVKELHQRGRCRLLIAFASNLPGALGSFRETDFSLVDRDIVLVVERETRIVGQQRALLSGYVSWKRNDLIFFDALYKQIASGAFGFTIAPDVTGKANSWPVLGIDDAGGASHDEGIVGPST